MLKKLFMASLAVSMILGGGFTSCNMDDDDDDDDTIAVTGVTLDNSVLTLTVGGDTETLTATVSPSNATDSTITWTTADSTVAKVSDGVVTAVSGGITTITATAGGKSASANVFVKPASSSSITNTYSLDNLYGKAWENTTNGVGFAIIDESNYIWFHNNSSYTGATKGTYTVENVAADTYMLTSTSGGIYGVKVTSDSTITLTLGSSHNGGTYEMTHVFSSLFGNTYSGTQGQMTHTLSITDSANCTYKATPYMPNETAYTYTITGVTADNTAKTLTYTMQWYKDGDKKGTHTVLITDAGITFDSLALTKLE